ncbi:hypothetical protein VKT23_008034 [Stygiomarasmius scandens]|uniref:Uncharacterized protein n=1 Tax=Marasmiellus scandens TaxID=2682957 RepID=A0ABR1JKB0_9AGAR
MLHDAQQLVALMEAIPLRCPSLVSMVMNVGSKPELVNPFASLAARLNHLTEIKIPSFPDVSKILSALGNRRNLKKLRFDFSNILSQGLSTYVSAVTSLENPLTEGFPSLEVLELPVQEHTTLCPLFQFDTHCLRSIQIDIGSLDGSVSPKPLLQSISRACPSLATFRLGYHHWNFDLRQFKDDVVGLDDLQDILTCSFMTCLDIVVPICLSLSDSDIRVMAQAWPNLHTLTLCSRSSMEKPENAKDLSLCSLFLLTRLCASIRCITLDIDTVASRTPSFQSLSANSTGQVANLEFLNIGRYPLESGDEVAVAKLLGQVCEPECMLKYNIRLEDLDDEDDNWLQEMSSRWETVRTLTRHFSELYSTIRSLELENTSLRSQVK